jgi:O-methyltransferase
MQEADFNKFLEDIEIEFANKPGISLGMLGFTPVTLRLIGALSSKGLIRLISGIYVERAKGYPALKLGIPIFDFEKLKGKTPDVLVVASDAQKEDIILAALPSMSGSPKLIVSGYGHLEFRDSIFTEEKAQLLVPSFANGYPNTLIHIYQCLKNAARLGLDGVVAEFGMFKGGTTMLMAKLIRRLGAKWPIMGFDSFQGFPPRRSPLDMYDHPGCIFTDLPAVKRYFTGENVKIIAGDIVETVKEIKGQKIVLAFIDTDNYTPARAILEVIPNQIEIGGAIVFDHFTGIDKFRYTLGERLAAMPLLDDKRFLNLHGTGVFFRQK